MLVQKALNNIYESNRIKEDQVYRIKRSIDDFIKLLKKRVPFKDMKLCPIYYQYYGSFCNGFGLRNSDVDFTILTDSYVEESILLQEISNILKKSNKPFIRFEVNEEILKARIPNLQIIDRLEQVDIDLSINNLLGAINTKLLYSYSQLHPFVQQGGVLIKVWAKAQNLIKVNKFSSYALILMWIYFLQQKHKLPNLQDQAFQKELDYDDIKLSYKRKVFKVQCYQLEVFVVNTFFMNDKQKQQELMRDVFSNILLQELLIQFWEYYSSNGEYVVNESVISIHSSKVKKRQHLFQIDDPFDLLHDPGKRASVLSEDDFEKFKMAALALRRNEAKIQNALQYVIGHLKRIKFSDAEWPSVRYHSFGSQGNGFGTSTSDIDLTLMTDHYTPEISGLAFIFRSLKQVVNDQFKVEFTKAARIPFITISYQGQDVDIIMNNILGIVNTKLLKSYSLLHEKVKAGGILLKIWGKKNNVIGKSMISSYALILMWICFLQRKFGLPDLQDQIYTSFLQYNEEDYMLTVRRQVNGRDENFKTDPRFIYYKMPLFQELQQKCQNLNNYCIESLLQQFWAYYTVNGEFFRVKQKISIHQQDKLDENIPLAIIDPFDHEHNPGKKFSKEVQIKLFEKFREASIRSQNQIGQLFV